MNARLASPGLLAIVLVLSSLGAPVGAQEDPLPPPAMTIDTVEVEAVELFELEVDGESVFFDRRVVVRGGTFYGTSFGPIVSFDGVETQAAVLDSDTQVTAYVPTDVSGVVTLTVTNPDGISIELEVNL